MGEVIRTRRELGWSFRRICEGAWDRHGGWARAKPVLLAGLAGGAPLDDDDLEGRRARAVARRAEQWRTPIPVEILAGQAARMTDARDRLDRQGLRTGDDLRLRDLTRTIVGYLGVRDLYAIAAARMLLDESPHVLDAPMDPSPVSTWRAALAGAKRDLTRLARGGNSVYR